MNFQPISFSYVYHKTNCLKTFARQRVWKISDKRENEKEKKKMKKELAVVRNRFLCRLAFPLRLDL
ncbi:MAG TPA: hypothetical protein VF172_08940, partial [Nitrososphaera sp.]